MTSNALRAQAQTEQGLGHRLVHSCFLGAHDGRFPPVAPPVKVAMARRKVADAGEQPARRATKGTAAVDFSASKYQLLAQPRERCRLRAKKMTRSACQQPAWKCEMCCRSLPCLPRPERSRAQQQETLPSAHLRGPVRLLCPETGAPPPAGSSRWRMPVTCLHLGKGCLDSSAN